MDKKIFDYGLLTPELCQQYGIQKVSASATGFGKLFTDGTKPVLLNDGDDNDKFYGAVYSASEEAITALALLWPEYYLAEIFAYTQQGTFEAVTFAQTAPQVRKLEYLEYPEWRK